MASGKIEQFEQALQEKAKELPLKKAELEQLQRDKKQYDTQISILNGKIATILKRALEVVTERNLQNIDLTNIHQGSESADTDFINNVIKELNVTKKVHKTAAENAVKYKELLLEIVVYLNKEESWSGSKIALAIEKSKLSPKTGQHAFFWLIEDQLGLIKADYNFFYPISTGNRGALLKVLSKKIKSLEETERLENLEVSHCDTSHDELIKLQEDLRVDYNELSQSKSSLSHVSKKIEALEIRITAIPGEHQQLQFSLDEAKQEVVEQQKREELKRKALEEEQREKLKAQQDRGEVVNKIKQSLQEYQTERNKRFNVKDKVSPEDKNKRDTFIDDLNSLLNFYIESGDSKDVLAQIDAGVEEFPGVHLQTKLHQATLLLLDKTPEEVLVDKTSQILNRQQKQNSDYATKMNELLAKLTVNKTLMNKRDEDVVNSHIGQLKKDVVFFISQHQDAPPNVEAFNNFKIKFNARLHSQDVIMSKHENWNSFALNLFLGLISVGIALGIKAAYSKLTTGQATFFARQTEKQESLKDVEKTMGEVTKIMKP